MKEDCIFVHVPKTGGRSILEACGVPFTVRHDSIREMDRTLGRARLDRCFKFSVVRNPWDRAYSWWRFFIQKHEEYLQHRNDFEDWIANQDLTSHPCLTRMGISNPLDHMEWYRDEDNEIRIDGFLRFESLAQDFELLRDRIGALHPLGHRGGMGAEALELATPTTNHVHDYRYAYRSSKTIEWVGNLNRELCRRFNYTFFCDA